ncbi:MAG: F0F1 ATP synthase subunit delta, partial [Planctomycetota bacterium]
LHHQAHEIVELGRDLLLKRLPETGDLLRDGDVRRGQEGALSKRLSKIVGKKIELDVRVDPAVLGGMTVQVGDTRFDGSLRRALDELGARMAGTRIDSEVVYADQD